jgi:hypothetical protein
MSKLSIDACQWFFNISRGYFGIFFYSIRDGHLLNREKHTAIGRIYHKTHKETFRIEKESAPAILELWFEAQDEFCRGHEDVNFVEISSNIRCFFSM